MGDPAGIGPEISARAWEALRGSGLSFFLIGDIELARRHARSLNQPDPIIIDNPGEARDAMATGLPVLPLKLTAPVQDGQATSANAPAIISAIEQAAALTLKGEAGAVVTNPIAKSVLYSAGFSHPGHTEFLGELSKNAAQWAKPHGPVMMLSASGLRVALVTVHLALRDVIQAITPERISQSAQVLHHALKRDFGIEKPRIALCGLNPHAGEDGAMGDEEINIINPAASALRAQGINITHAQPADALFREDARQGYDAVLALYHDQGLIPVKTLDFHGGINTTLGLPFIRTSPDHGTGFSIAGKGIARSDSLIAALRAAAAMSEHRQGKSHA
jgi:4-hydroxythreonine-4-phosphate dehydrogenase